jgi:hypothetical protein
VASSTTRGSLLRSPRGEVIATLREPFDLLAETAVSAARAAKAEITKTVKSEIWLAFLNIVRTERFEEVLALRPILSTISATQAGSRSASGATLTQKVATI